MRPGEKLYEEVSTVLEDTLPTTHEKIRIYMGNGVHGDDMQVWLERLREICKTRDWGRLVLALKEMVIDYSPSADLLKRVIGVRGRHAVAAAGSSPIQYGVGSQAAFPTEKGTKRSAGIVQSIERAP